MRRKSMQTKSTRRKQRKTKSRRIRRSTLKNRKRKTRKKLKGGASPGEAAERRTPGREPDFPPPDTAPPAGGPAGDVYNLKVLLIIRDDPTSGKFYTVWVEVEGGGVPPPPPELATVEEGLAQMFRMEETEFKRLYTVILISHGKEDLSGTPLLEKISDPKRIKIKIKNSSKNPSIYNIEMPAKAMVKDVLLAFSSMHGDIEPERLAIIDKQWNQVDDSMDLEKIGGFTHAKMDEYHEFIHEELREDDDDDWTTPEDNFLRYNGTKKLIQEVGGGGAEPGGAGHAAPPAGVSERREAAAAQERAPSAAEETASSQSKVTTDK